MIYDWYWWCRCSDAAFGYEQHREEAIEAARRHWKRRHVEIGEEDTDEAKRDIGPHVTGPGMDFEGFTLDEVEDHD